MSTDTISLERKWYVARVFSGKERKIKEYIESEIKRSGWSDIVTQVLVPLEKVYKIKNGKRTIKERNLFPGYVLFEADDKRMSGEILQTIRSVSGVMGYLGEHPKEMKPQPLSKAEVNRILGKVDEMEESTAAIHEPFVIGETVKIIDGPFNDFNGVIEEINDEKKKLKVVVKIFGRRQPVELNFVQVEKQT